MAPISESQSLEQLQDEWKEIFQKTLPEAATSKSPSQPKWPVHVDHCFARIILDSTVGIDSPWMSKIKSPAYKNMTREQLQASIELGRQILEGEVDLVELDNKSLELRGQENGSGRRSGRTSKETTAASSGKRRRGGESDSMNGEEEDGGVKKRRKEFSPPSDELVSSIPLADPSTHKPSSSKEDFTPYLKKIALCDKTSFQKKVLTVLCQVPRGRYTTYAAISKHLSSSPRAVGNALKNNPFAPQVPCHRVLASGGGIGGFHGSWGRNGKEGLNDDKKRKLLRDEGVKFDGKGRVVGTAWDGFK